MENNVDKMPEPQVVNYRQFFEVTEVFINDYKICANNIAYVDAIKVLNLINRNDRIVNSATLNEIIRIIGSFPYKYVHALMENINNKEIFPHYFIEKPKDFNPGF